MIKRFVLFEWVSEAKENIIFIRSLSFGDFSDFKELDCWYKEVLKLKLLTVLYIIYLVQISIRYINKLWKSKAKLVEKEKLVANNIDNCYSLIWEWIQLLWYRP